MTLIQCFPLALLVACASSSPDRSTQPLPGEALLVSPPDLPVGPPVDVLSDAQATVHDGFPLSDAFEGGVIDEASLALAATTTTELDMTDGGCGESNKVEVRPGENLYLLASWAGTTIEAIAELNQLDPAVPLYPGQLLDLPEADSVVLDDLRASFASSQVEAYLTRRGGLIGVESHQVRTGETAWSVALDRAGVPLWVLAAFNPQSDLDALSIGDRLRVPVVADIVAEMDDEPEGGLEDQL